MKEHTFEHLLSTKELQLFWVLRHTESMIFRDFPSVQFNFTTKKRCFAKKLFKVLWLKYFSKVFYSDTSEERFCCRCLLISCELSALNSFKSICISIFSSTLVDSKRLLMLLAKSWINGLFFVTPLAVKEKLELGPQN